MDVTLLLWILSLIITGMGGSYWFTWSTLQMWRHSIAKLWQAIDKLKTNEIKHIQERLNVLEKDK